MDKSVISTFRENIELAASKYDSISVHLNALRQRVLGAGRPLDSLPVAPVLHSNEQEARKSESHGGLSSSEDKKLDPKSITSDNEIGFCDAKSSISGSSITQDTESGSKDEESMKEDNIKIQEYGITNGNKGLTEIEKKISGISGFEEEDYLSSNLNSSGSDSSSTSDEENIYSELLKRMEYEEEKKSLNNGTHLSKLEEECDSQSHETNSIYVHNIVEPTNENCQKGQDKDKKEGYFYFDKSFGERAKQIMDSIEEDNEEWEVLGEQLVSGKMEEIGIDKLFSLKQKIFEEVIDEDVSEDSKFNRTKSREYDNKSIKTNRTNSRVSETACKKTSSQRTLCSRRISKDYLNSTFIDSQSYKTESVTSNKKSKVSSKTTESLGRERVVKKKTSNILKHDSSKKFLKSEKPTKSKPINMVQKKFLMGNTKLSKISKVKNNASKTVSRNIPQKNVQIKPRQDQGVKKNLIKNEYTKKNYNVKRQESTENVVENKLSPSSSNDKIIKHIEPLIKSKPDNIFLKNELDRITENTLNEEKGSGDGPDNVRSQAIISSMNQSLNRFSKSNVPSHIIKSNKKVEIGPSFRSQSSSKLKQSNKDNVSSINGINKNDQLSFKKSVQNVFKNIRVEDYKSDMTLPELKIGNKPTMSRRESSVTDPKEILAQLEKEVSFAKVKDSFIDDKDLKTATHCKLSQTTSANCKEKEIFYRKDIKLDKYNAVENELENNLFRQKKETKCSSFTIEPKSSKLINSKGSKDMKRKSNKIKSTNKLKNNDLKSEFHQQKRNELVQKEHFATETISNTPNKILTLNFDGPKAKITNFPFILGQSTSKSYNIQANVQQTLSIMMMLPSESVRRTLSVEAKVSSKASTQTALTTQSHQVKCPACVLKNDQEYPQDNLMDDPWDTEYTSRNFVRCTCIPRNTVSFKTVMKQLLSETSIGSLLPMSETSTLYEESIDKNNESKQLCRRNDLSHLTKLLHATQRIRGRLVT